MRIVAGALRYILGTLVMLGGVVSWVSGTIRDRPAFGGAVWTPKRHIRKRAKADEFCLGRRCCLWPMHCSSARLR